MVCGSGCVSALSRTGRAYRYSTQREIERERGRTDATQTTCWKCEKMTDEKKRSKIECRVCKVKISYGAGSTNNLHRHIGTVHPSVQLEEKIQASKPATNEGASLSTATAASTMSTVSTVHHHNHLDLQPRDL